MLTHVPRANQGPSDTPEDTWVVVGTNAHLRLSARTPEGVRRGRTSPADLA